MKNIAQKVAESYLGKSPLEEQLLLSHKAMIGVKAAYDQAKKCPTLGLLTKLVWKYLHSNERYADDIARRFLRRIQSRG